MDDCMRELLNSWKELENWEKIYNIQEKFGMRFKKDKSVGQQFSADDFLEHLQTGKITPIY